MQAREDLNGQMEQPACRIYLIIFFPCAGQGRKIKHRILVTNLPRQI